MKRQLKKLMSVFTKAASRKAKRIPNRRLGYESLECRQLMTSVVDGTLLIDPGTPQADHVTVEMDYGSPRTKLDDKVVVTQSNGRSVDTRAFDVFRNNRGTWRRDITNILWRAGDGNDKFENTTPISARAYGDGGNDSLLGGAGRDVLVGGTGRDNIWGGGGPDKLYGDGGIGDTRGSDDFIRGGPGNDFIIGGPGADWVFGGDESDDWYVGGSDGHDRIVGGPGKDYLFGQGGNDRIWGGFPSAEMNATSAEQGMDDDDQLYGGSGNDRMKGGYGEDRLQGGEGNDLAWGEQGRDELYGDEGADRLWGGEGRDQLYGGKGNDRLAGQKGDDRILGEHGADVLLGGSGADFLRGGGGSDRSFGQKDNDILVADRADIRTRGGAGENIVSWEKSKHNDGVSLTAPGIYYNHVTKTVSIYGSDFADEAKVWKHSTPTPDINSPPLATWLYVSLGRYESIGGQLTFVPTDSWMSSPNVFGVDLVKFWGNSGDDKFQNDSGIQASAWGGPGNDVLSGAAGGWLYGEEDNDQLFTGNSWTGATLYGGAGEDVLTGSHGADLMYGDAANDVLHGGGGSDVIYGGIGNDYVNGGSGDDTVYGYNGNDTILGGSGNDHLYGQSGDDHLLGQDGYDELHGGSGADSLEGGEGGDKLYGESDDDLLQGDHGHDTLSGGTGHDTIRGNAGNDKLYGYSGDDNLYGGSGDDKLFGGSGDDGLFGGGGSDQLHGGFGEDRFLVARDQNQPAVDSISDLQSSDARLDFVNGSATGKFTAGVWQDGQIETVDRALAVLHHKTGNTKLLKRANGGGLNFVRLGGPGVAWNNDQGNITYVDAAFSSDLYLIEVVFHEMGHNWDNEPQSWSFFLAQSNWLSWSLSQPVPNGYMRAQFDGEDFPWIYSSSAKFASNYGRSNPHDDLACAFAAFFMKEAGLTYGDGPGIDEVPNKGNYIETYIA